MKFSIEDISLASDKEIIFRKCNLLDLVASTFEELKIYLWKELLHETKLLQKYVTLNLGKVSRGENYNKMPFVVLDSPCVFEKENLITIRTLFLWGNEITCSIIIKGKYVDLFQSRLIAELSGNKFTDIYYCINSTPWEYFITENNLLPLTAITTNEMNEHANRNSFIKLTASLPFSNAEKLSDFVLTTSKQYFNLLMK